MSDRRRRGWRWALLFVAVLGVASLGVAVANRQPLLERWVLGQLRERGVEDAALSVDHFGLDRLTIRDVRVGEGDLELRALDLHYSFGGLLRARLDALRIEGLRVRGSLEESGVRFGALDALRGDDVEAPKGPTRFPALPVARLEVEETNLTLETAEGPFVATFAVHLDEAGDGRIALAATSFPALDTALGLRSDAFVIGGTVAFRPERLELNLDPAPFSVTLADGDGRQRILGTTPAIQLLAEPEGVETLHLRAQGGKLSLPDRGIEASGFEIEASVEAATRLPHGHVAIREVRDSNPMPQFPPLALVAEFLPGDGAIALKGTLTGADGRLVLRARGSHDPASGAGRLGVTLDPLRFEGGGLRPIDLSPAHASLLRTADGTVEASGELSWSAAGVTGFIDLGLRDLTLETPTARLERVNAALRIDGPWPPSVRPGQLISMARVDFGLELTNGLVVYTVREDQVVEIERGEWQFAGGTIRTEGSIDFAAEERSILLTARDVDLAQLLELVNLEGLSGTGRLQGSLPLVVRGDSIEIRGAVLEATSEGGSIRYLPDGQASAVASAAGMAFGDLLLALENFRYEQLRLTVDGEAQGEVVVAVSLHGAHAEHRDAQPYEFNLNLDGRLGDLVRQSSAVYQIPAEIEARLAEIAEASP